jgi:hypothetical protein
MMMAQKTFFATFMGNMAAEALAVHPQGNIMGITSKGIFLRCGDFVLFVTDAPYKSPFNLYVPGFERLMAMLTQGTQFSVSTKDLHFPVEDLQILTENAEVWTPAPPAILKTSSAQREQIVQSLLGQITSLEPGKGWLFLYNQIPAFPVELEDRIRANTRSFTSSYREQDLDRCLEAATHLLGLGGGLTPSGDDWLAGFVLYQVRLGKAQDQKQPFLASLTGKLLTLAVQKTTTISTNRILAAGRGWAEEPFLQVIDTLFTGDDFPPGLAELLVRFGHSSGVDTTVGIHSSMQGG